MWTLFSHEKNRVSIFEATFFQNELTKVKANKTKEEEKSYDENKQHSGDDERCRREDKEMDVLLLLLRLYQCFIIFRWNFCLRLHVINFHEIPTVRIINFWFAFYFK